MRKALWFVIVFGTLVMAAGPVEAKKKGVAGTWTLTIENLPMRFVLGQK
jgi:hypothetical protein